MYWWWPGWGWWFVFGKMTLMFLFYLSLIIILTWWLKWMMESTSGKQERRCTGVYGWLETTNKHHTCDLIHHLPSSYSTVKWMSFGDFNLILNWYKKQGGNDPSTIFINLFRDTLNQHNLFDLGYVGGPFTWKIYQDGESNIKARLERYVATSY